MRADALRVDLPELVPPPRQIVANLPYNVASPLLVRWLRQASAYERMTLMFQREVAERIVAAPDTPAYGRLSVLAGWICATPHRGAAAARGVRAAAESLVLGGGADAARGAAGPGAVRDDGAPDRRGVRAAPQDAPRRAEVTGRRSVAWFVPKSHRTGGRRR
jgi:hypothetical protein